MRRGAFLAACFVLPLLGGGEARAANECDGLDVCVSVPGPWVAVPAAPRTGLSTVHYRMTCPRRAIVGGLDANLGDRALDVGFLGLLGSPVNPGITTKRSVVFVVTSALGRATSFRPFVGCIPTSGGGGRQNTSVVVATPLAVRAGPPVRRVRTLPVRPGAGIRATVRCARGERLVSVSHALAFRVGRRPVAAILGGVTTTVRRRAGVAVVGARRARAIARRVRVEVQVHTVCARGR